MKVEFKPYLRYLLNVVIIFVMIWLIICVTVIFEPVSESLIGIEEGTKVTGTLLKEMVNNSVKVVIKEDGKSLRLTRKDSSYFQESKKYNVLSIIYNSDNKLLECYLEYKSKPESIIDREPVKRGFR